MWRAFFLALGATFCVMGAESLLLDHAVLRLDTGIVQKSNATEPVFDEFGFEIGRKPASPKPKVIRPPDWAPWSLLSTGAVTVLYAMAYRSEGG